jgi:rhamnogalacturonan hydrolase
MFSSTGKGAIQGNGYQIHKTGSTSGPRLLRVWDITNWSVHDITLVDSPSFHFSIDTCTNGEVYNMAIRGGNEGGLDGIDVWSNNIWIHDVMVTNKGRSDPCAKTNNHANQNLR